MTSRQLGPRSVAESVREILKKLGLSLASEEFLPSYVPTEKISIPIYTVILYVIFDSEGQYIVTSKDDLSVFSGGRFRFKLKNEIAKVNGLLTRFSIDENNIVTIEVKREYEAFFPFFEDKVDKVITSVLKEFFSGSYQFRFDKILKIDYL